MSIMASFTSAVSILGFALEMYRFGSMYLLIGMSYFITQPFAAAVYVPFFHRLKITSAYEVKTQFYKILIDSIKIVFLIENNKVFRNEIQLLGPLASLNSFLRRNGSKKFNSLIFFNSKLLSNANLCLSFCTWLWYCTHQLWPFNKVK
jgi:hypothetical protein